MADIISAHMGCIVGYPPLDKLQNTVNHRKRSADSLVAAHFRAQNVILEAGLVCGMSAN